MQKSLRMNVVMFTLIGLLTLVLMLSAEATLGSKLVHAASRTPQGVGTCSSGFHSHVITYHTSYDLGGDWVTANLVGLYDNNDHHFCGLLASRAVGSMTGLRALAAYLQSNTNGTYTETTISDSGSIESNFITRSSDCAVGEFPLQGLSATVCAAAPHYD